MTPTVKLSPRALPLVRFAGIKACVFDAYGTLFDVNAAARALRDEIGAQWQAFADTWRSKQLSYTWLRNSMGHFADFQQVTQDALDFALAAHRLDAATFRERLMQLYFTLSPYPEVPETLRRLKGSGLTTAILSNGSLPMLKAAARSAGIETLIDAIFSVDAVGVYKPDPRVYALATDGLGLTPQAISFQSSNAWDAHGAKLCGFRVVWCNRLRQPAEHLPGAPDAEIETLTALPAIVAPD
jgi:2-haloacid dehalogenase